MSKKHKVFTEELGFELVLLLMFIIMFSASLGYSKKAVLFPWMVLAPLLAWFLIRVARMLLKKRAGEDDGENSLSERAQKAGDGYKEIAAALILGGSVVLIGLLGIVLGGALFMALYLMFFGKEGWRYYVFAPVVLAALVYIIFVQLLSVQLYQGVVLSLLGI